MCADRILWFMNYNRKQFEAIKSLDICIKSIELVTKFIPLDSG